MAENYNCNVEGNKCYGEGGKVGVYDETGSWQGTWQGTWQTLSKAEIQANCDKYGRLYDWATAMGIDAKYNEEKWNGSDVKHQGICPSGWHIPSNTDWYVLMNFANPSCYYGGCDGAGNKLKATSGWYNYDGESSGNGTDDYGFSALPGGGGYSDGSFNKVGYDGFWWSTSECPGLGAAATRGMSYQIDGVYDTCSDKGALYSVRCLKD